MNISKKNINWLYVIVFVFLFLFVFSILPVLYQGKDILNNTTTLILFGQLFSSSLIWYVAFKISSENVKLIRKQNKTNIRLFELNKAYRDEEKAYHHLNNPIDREVINDREDICVAEKKVIKLESELENLLKEE